MIDSSLSCSTAISISGSSVGFSTESSGSTVHLAYVFWTEPVRVQAFISYVLSLISGFSKDESSRDLASIGTPDNRSATELSVPAMYSTRQL